MEEYRGKYRKTSAKASAYAHGREKTGGKFLRGMFKQTIWSAIILAAIYMISSSASPAAQSAAKYIKSAVNYKPDISWAVESINTFFGKAEAPKTEEENNTDGSVPVSAEDKNEGILE